MPRFFEYLPRALAEGQPFALAVISGIKGSSPQKKGAKALFYLDGRIQGTLGGGCLEAEIQDRARRALLSHTPASFELVLDHDFGWDDGLICGGKVCGVILPRAAEAAALWQEVARRETRRTWGVKNDFSIAGSGHVAQSVAPLALQLDFDVTVFDDRPSLANGQFFPPGTRFRVGAW